MRLASLISAMMTKQPFLFFDVKCQWRIAVWAAQDMSAVAAEDISGSAPPVQEQDRLFAALERRLKLLKQEPAKNPALTRFQFLPHIHNLDGWQPCFENATWQLQSP